MTNVTYPGVYIEEIPSGVRTISGVATSITAFIGRTLRGPLDTPVRVQSFGEYQRIFGGQWLESTLSYAVQQYFQNGGADAIIVRVANSAGAASIDVASSGTALTFEAANPGTWGDKLTITIDHETKDPGTASLFNLTIQEADGTTVLAEEKFMNVSVLEANPRFVQKFLEQNSSLLRLTGSAPFDNPTDGDYDVTSDGSPGSDGSAVSKTQISDASLEADREGLWALESVDLFNLLCIPPFERETDVDQDTWDAALKYCQDHRAMLIVDPPASWTKPSDISGSAILSVISERDKNAALYFPRIQASDPLQENRLETFAPCGAVAGIFARTDATRGVWKAPAGQEATLSGVRALAYKMTDGENGILNPLGVNCLRNFATSGNTVWGARTMEGADNLASEWKYIPVRRTALYIEESLFRGTQWVVFEPNDEPLWAQIRLNIGAFMNTLFRQGAFQGKTPREAYFVKCDRETTTQDDINRGVVNILVGFAPLKPAEFVVIKIQQMAGQIEAEEVVMAQFSVNPQRFDPYKNFKFRVKWGGRFVAGISKVGGLKRTTEVVKHREGGDPSITRKSPGRSDFEAITLERGVTHDQEFEQWANKVWNWGSGLGAEVSLKDFRKDIIIEVYNEAGQLAIAYKVYRCWVSEFQALPDLDANANAVAIQHIKLENEGWERDYEVNEPAEPSFTEP